VRVPTSRRRANLLQDGPHKRRESRTETSPESTLPSELSTIMEPSLLVGLDDCSSLLASAPRCDRALSADRIENASCAVPHEIYDLSDTITKNTVDVYNVLWICYTPRSGLFRFRFLQPGKMIFSRDESPCDALGRKDARTSGVCTVQVAWLQRTITLAIGMAAACMYLYLYGRTTSGQALESQLSPLRQRTRTMN
jgi:hypothetical protein